MHLNYLADFIDLANTLNFSASAKNLNVSQSTLSRHIQSIERDIGVQLFDRTSGKTTLTAAGKNLYQKAQQIEDSIAEFSYLIKPMSQSQMTTLYVSGQTILPSVNLFFSTMAAQARIQQSSLQFQYRGAHSFSGEIPPQFSLDLLRSGEIDLAIETMGEGSGYFETFDYLSLYEEKLSFVVSPDNPLLHKTHVHPKDLAGYTTTHLEMFPKTKERYGNSDVQRGFDALRVDKVIVSDALEISAYLSQLDPTEIIQFPASLCALFPFGAKGTNSIILNVERSHSINPIYLFFRAGLDPLIIQMITSLALTVRSYFYEEGYSFLVHESEAGLASLCCENNT
ncbi:LysR family transcriptional regulator [Eggerthella sp. YY7918]|uniref:LysR family transcriptional regulator n=1 Tax=Eggerthella sp. (strain YY7918) TaxID=502558 RepID=UPI0002171459|nr:LysR family transcriptional regulator [Eggerthella sp. YY7918]BAK44869.1 transcriptional regulator [Eggerthella sp. YY7918]